MTGSDNINRPSASPDLDWYKRKTVLRQSAGDAARSNQSKEAERNCEKKLGHSFENEVQTVSPNATNISR